MKPSTTTHAASPASAAPQGQYLSPPDLERAARQLLAQNVRNSLLSLRVAAWGALHHGNDWFRIHDARFLIDASGERHIWSGRLAKQLQRLDICETRVVSDGSRRIHEVRITCLLYPISHHHGRKSAILVDAMNQFTEGHSCGTPFALLLLIAAHVYQIVESVELGKFLEPTSNRKQNLALAPRLLKWLEAVNLVQIHRIHSGVSRPYLVIPVGQPT